MMKGFFTKIGAKSYFTAATLAGLLGARSRTVRDMIQAGKLKGKKHRGRWFVPVEEARKRFFDIPAPVPGKEDLSDFIRLLPALGALGFEEARAAEVAWKAGDNAVLDRVWPIVCRELLRQKLLRGLPIR